MAASIRVWLLTAVLACTLLARSADADGAEAAVPSPAPEGGPSCNPLLDKTCKPGDPKEPENQEEESGTGVRLPSLPSLPNSLPSLPLPGLGKVDRDGDGDIDEDDELPKFNTHMTILGH